LVDAQQLSFSVVVTAPDGIQACRYLDAWIAELAGTPGEIIVADGSDKFIDCSSGRLHHIHCPETSVQGLMTAGAAIALGDWVLLSEDHCRPLPAIIAQYRDRIEREPLADLIAGTVDNLTSRGPWSFAIFAIGLSQFWREAHLVPDTATNANALFRRHAIAPDELTVSGGLLNLTAPRLAHSGRLAICRTAVVDHVVHLDRGNAVDFEFACTAGSINEYRALAPLSLPADIWDSIKRAIGCALIVPARVARNLRGTSQSRLALLSRVTFVCVAVAWRLVLMDTKRLWGRRQSGRVAATTSPYPPA